MPTSYIFLATTYYFNVALSSALYKPERSEGKVFNVKIISEQSERKYICNNKHAERSEAKVFIYYIVSETNEVSERIYIIM